MITIIRLLFIVLLATCLFSSSFGAKVIHKEWPRATPVDYTLPQHSFESHPLSHCSHEQFAKGNCNSNNNAAHRSLLQVTLPDPVYIPLTTSQQTSAQYLNAISYIWTHLSPTSSQFILYPYNFTQNFATPTAGSSLHSYPQGAFISIQSATPPTSFASVIAETNINLNNAQVVYDSSIAIFESYGVLAGDPTLTVRLLTQEAPNVCQALYNGVSGKWSQCWTSASWLSYLASNVAHEASSIVYVTAQDISNGILFSPSNPALPRFGSLIFPDIYFGSDQTILSSFNASTYTQIQTYLNNGGTVISSGKGAIIVEKLGLIPNSPANVGHTPIFNNQVEVATIQNYLAVPTSGCEQNYVVTNNEFDFIKRTLCFALGTGRAGGVNSALLSGPQVNTSALSQASLSVISYFNPTSGGLITRDQSGVATAVPTTSMTSYPQILYGSSGKGQLVINLGNAPIDSASWPYLYNSLFLSNTRPMLIDSFYPIGSPIIPALEQVAVSVELVVSNIYADTLNNVKYLVWVGPGLSVTSVPSGCVVGSTAGYVAPVTGLNTSILIDCSPANGQLGPLASISGNFTVFFYNPSVTSVQSGIVLVHPSLSYAVPSRGGLIESADTAITVSAYNAAECVGDYNGDPIGWYPLPGPGVFVDNVLGVQNNQDTTAFNFQHVAIVPLITPAVDISNQAEIAHTMEFDSLYYSSSINGIGNYLYPMTNPPYSAAHPAPIDYLDYLVLTARTDALAANWDEPILPAKVVRNSSFPSVQSVISNVASISGGQYDISNTNNYVVIKQTAFYDAQNYFTYPSPRMQAFLDTSLPQSYQTYNAPSSPVQPIPSWSMNSQGTAQRQTLVFGANSVYFYAPLPGEVTYPLPLGVTDYNTVITIDRYSQTPVSGNNSCKSGTQSGSASVRTVNGYYTNTDSALNPPGMKPNEYSNGITNWCTHINKQIDGSTLSAASNGASSVTHYIVRLTYNPTIASGDDVMYMMRDTSVTTQTEWYYAPSTVTGVARYGNYPELRMKYILGASFLLPDPISIRGGYLYIQLPTGWSWGSTNPIANDWVTWSADQVSFTGVTYNAATGMIASKFYRGELPDETNGTPSNLQVNLEDLVWSGSGAAPTTVNMQLTFSTLTYNLGFPPTYEQFTPVPSFTQTLVFTKQIALSLPALKLTFQYNRTPTSATTLTPSSSLLPNIGSYKNISYLLAYEDEQPFVRYGVYTQELMAHRPVYGSAQINPVSDTGLVTVNSGVSYITHIGESSIPYRQYLSAGAGQMIPATAYTGRMQWTDLWGRTLAEPLRSLFIDIAPIPAPLRNFDMTTTFEILNPTSNARDLVWHSDDTVTVRTQVKLINNYEKWFVLTNSAYNQLIFSAQGSFPGQANFVTNGQTYSNILPTSTQTTLANQNNIYLNYGFTNVYGTSFGGGSVWLNGTSMSPTQEFEIANAIYCVSNYSSACDYIGKLPIPSMRPSTTTVNPPTTWWNYASRVDSYWPAGYITSDMWDLTHPNYDINVFDYGYNYQFDNRLPNLDSGLTKPQNLISFPIYKGLGYNMVYSNSLSHPNFPGYTGWWSDQLQNKDDTLIAGQTTSNTISVNAADLTASVGWTPINNLVGVDTPSTSATTLAVNAALGNIYTCLFNRNRINTRSNNTRASNPLNVLQNNVVPVDPTLSVNDARLTNYNCDLTTNQLTAKQVSSYNNYVSTLGSSDYLYFAANLRGGAVEDINILYSMTPISVTGTTNLPYEGPSTVAQEGGEFIYWNPSLGPNCYETVTDPTSVISAVRTDLTITEIVIPTVTTTFNAHVFQILTLSDLAEVNRVWPLAVADQTYGFGDSAVRTYVGGMLGSSNILNPGDTTYVEIDFYNNAGFDWNLYASAITGYVAGTMAVNAWELLANVAPVVVVPTAYNFMTVHIPAVLQPYVTIVPYGGNADVAPMQFDFTSINVATIRDGYQGSYFYQVSVSSNLPVSLMGRIYAIPVSLNMSYFDKLPGWHDPTGTTFHNYQLSIPNITIGFPYPSSSPWAGNTYYTNGFAHNIQFNHELDSAFSPLGAVLVNQADINNLQILAGTAGVGPTAFTNYFNGLNNTWNKPVSMKVTAASGSLNSINFNYTTISSTGLFPIAQSDLTQGPDTAQISILVHTYAASLLPSYQNRVTANSIVTYQDWKNVAKTSSVGTALAVNALGAYLTSTYLFTLLDSTLKPLLDQSLRCNDTGTAQIKLTVQNTGTASAYDIQMFSSILGATVSTLISQPPNIGLTVNLLSYPVGSSSNVNVSITTSEVLAAGSSLTAIFYITYLPLNLVTCPTTRVFSTGAAFDFALLSSGENVVSQNLNKVSSVPIVKTPRLAITFNVTESTSNSQQYIITPSQPNAALATVLTYISTSAYPTLPSNTFAYAFQYIANVTMENKYNNGTILSSQVLTTVFVSPNTNSYAITLPSNWIKADFEVVVGIASVASRIGNVPNPAASFIPAAYSSVIEINSGYQQPSTSSSSSSNAALIAEIVVPIGIFLILCCICLVCLLMTRRPEKKEKTDYTTAAFNNTGVSSTAISRSNSTIQMQTPPPPMPSTPPQINPYVAVVPPSLPSQAPTVVKAAPIAPALPTNKPYSYYEDDMDTGAEGEGVVRDMPVQPTRPPSLPASRPAMLNGRNSSSYLR